MSLAVEVSTSSDPCRDLDSVLEPPLNTSAVSQVSQRVSAACRLLPCATLLFKSMFFVMQRIVSPETDSGFGSSYLNQSASGSSHPNLLSERYQSE